MCVSLLMTSDNKRKGYALDIPLRPIAYQDSPKEDNILCPDCEELIGFYEKHLASEFYYYHRDKEKSNTITQSYLANGILKVSYNNNSVLQIKRALASMLFRAHITSLPFSYDLSLTFEQVEILRSFLLCDTEDLACDIYVITSNDIRFTYN